MRIILHTSKFLPLISFVLGIWALTVPVYGAAYTDLSDANEAIDDTDDVTLTNTADTSFAKTITTTGNFVKDGTA